MANIIVLLHKIYLLRHVVKLSPKHLFIPLNSFLSLIREPSFCRGQELISGHIATHRAERK